ncbi:hypothetical protein CFAM422_010906 [Trichoderma lentiforme]|uniref:Uncharacterized protein n=1 Tax=Trichoderma lentiforme TaxID=1567552 RepID=A0A9P5C956_9HYPO|nr:hypothetical protein CFAM422_010906 [Trichoderma lentiforme]
MEHRTSPEPGAFVQLAVERSGGRRRSHTSNLGDSQNPAITPTPSVALLAPTTRPPRPSPLAHADAASATLLACFDE